jgi:polyisoprenyl-teichoic acid--peptidoglycan teichoic acid transferase
MRISRGCLGIFSFMALLVMTGLCSVVAYAGMRGAVVDLWGQGVKVDSIGKVAQSLLDPNSIKLSAQNAGLNAAALPTLTPTTIVPTAAPQVAATTDPLVTPATPDPLVTVTATQEVAAVAAPTQDAFITQKWEDPRQIRILLLGIDQRNAAFETEKVFRSDTMILVNIDPVRKTIGVLSFPRDLYVDIPGSGKERINAAMRIGDLIAYPGGGGPALAAETIASNFGVRVDYYIVVNFSLFEAVVDTLAPDGVEICVPEAIDDPYYPDVGYGTMHVTFDPGCQRLKAERLLQFARTRHGNSDFDRAKRQQQTLEAVRVEILNAGGITRFVTQIPTLWNELKANYRTNLNLDEIIKIGNLVMEVPRENIHYATIDVGDVTFGKTDAGDEILIPIMSDITTRIESVLYPDIGGGTAPGGSTDAGTSSNTVTAGSSADLLTKMQAEAAPIYVYNGTDIGGLAAKTQEWLIGKGIRVAGVGNDATHGGAPTVIRDYGGRAPNTGLYLAQLLGIPADRVQPGADGLVSSGVVIVIGPDVQSLLTGGR